MEKGLREELIGKIVAAKSVLKNIRKRIGFDFKRVNLEETENSVEVVGKRLKTKWYIEKVLNENQILIPNNTPALKLLYGEYASFVKLVVQ